MPYLVLLFAQKYPKGAHGMPAWSLNVRTRSELALQKAAAAQTAERAVSSAFAGRHEVGFRKQRVDQYVSSISSIFF